MAESTKHGGELSLISEIKTLLSLSRTKRTLQFAYGFMLALLLFTVFLAFSPNSSNTSFSPSFSGIFSASSVNTSSIFSQQSYRSHFSSVVSYFFPNSTSSVNDSAPSYSVSSQFVQNRTQNRDSNSVIRVPESSIAKPSLGKDQISVKNETQKSGFDDKVGAFGKNQSAIGVFVSPISAKNKTQNTNLQSPVGFSKSGKNGTKLAPKSTSIGKNSTEKQRTMEKGVGVISNLTSSLVKKQGGNGSNSTKQRIEDLIKGLANCNLFDGEWIRDDTYPLYKPGSCSLIDEQFNCFLNGRPDNGYYKLKWKPKGCSIPRLNGTHMLEMLRGKRLVFVGDSLNRNMWESLVCILRNSVKDQTKVYEASGRHHFRTEPSYSFVFKDYDCTVEFFVSPFLVQEWEMADKKSGSKKETLRLDLVGRSANQYKTADILIFNTGHWWTHDKTAKGKDYYQEGSHVYNELNVLEAFRKALTTWGRWIDANVNPKKSMVLFRGYSASHFSGGQWNSGGACDNETVPIKNTTYLSQYPPKMTVLEKILKNMKTRVSYLNITRLTDYRKDGHPSIYRKQYFTEEEKRSPLSFQDCSHWCLPGVPDAWNEILYSELLIRQSQNKQ